MKHSSVVEQHVDLAEAREGVIDCAATVIGDADVGADEEGLSAIPNDGLDNLLYALGVTPGDSDRRTLACEALGSGTADPGGSSGDQVYPSLQPHDLASRFD